jgi:hypothetical protein
VKVKWLATLTGQVYNDPRGKQRGQVGDIDDELAKKLIAQGLVQTNWQDEPGPPYQPGDHRPGRQLGIRRVLEGWTR